MVFIFDAPSHFNLELLSLSHTLKENDLVLTKADKSASSIILDRLWYIHKIEQFLIASRTVKIKFNLDEEGYQK
mgnify:CR=1 FL=1